MAKKTSHVARQFAKRVLKASKKKKRKERTISKQITFNRALEQLETKVEKKEEDHITFLLNRVKGLERELRISEKATEDATNLNRQRIEELYSELDHLRERMSKVIGVKTARQRRVEELERRVKERAASIDIHKVIEMEHQLKQMQEKYEQLKQQQKYSPASLATAKIVIESLRRRIDAKKREAIPAERVEPSVIPSERMSSVRHTMKFEVPVPKKTIPAEEEIKPELPSLPPPPKHIEALKEGKIPTVPPDLVKKPKRTFKQKLRIFFLGKPKPKFKGLK